MRGAMAAINEWATVRVVQAAHKTAEDLSAQPLSFRNQPSDNQRSFFNTDFGALSFRHETGDFVRFFSAKKNETTSARA